MITGRINQGVIPQSNARVKKRYINTHARNPPFIRACDLLLSTLHIDIEKQRFCFKHTQNKVIFCFTRYSFYAAKQFRTYELMRLKICGRQLMLSRTE